MKESEPMSRETVSRVSQINFNTWLMIVALAALGWIGNTVVKVNEKVTRMEAQQEIRVQMEESRDKRLSVVEAIIGVKPKP